jgi:hypothetical protein
MLTVVDDESEDVVMPELEELVVDHQTLDHQDLLLWDHHHNQVDHLLEVEDHHIEVEGHHNRHHIAHPL